MKNLFNNKIINLQPPLPNLTQDGYTPTTLDNPNKAKLNTDLAPFAVSETSEKNGGPLDLASLTVNEISEKVGEPRQYPPANQEWTDSVYSYNKNYVKTLPMADNMVNKLIKSYFNMTPLQDGKKSKRVEIRFRRLSLNRILVSRADMKHTSNKITITVYIYNKNRKFLYYKLKSLYNTFIMKMASINIKNKLNNGKIGFNPVQRKNGTLGRKTYKALTGRKTAHGPSTNKNYILYSIKLNKKGYNTNTANLKKKMFSTKRFKTSNQKQVSFFKINNSSNFYNFTKNKLSIFLSKIKTPNLKNKYKTLIGKYYTILNDYNFNTTGGYHNYYLNLASVVNQGLNVNKYKTSSFYSFLNTKSKSLHGSQVLEVTDKGLNTNNKNLYFKSKAFKLSNKLSKSVKVKNLMYKLRNFYKLFGFNHTYNEDIRSVHSNLFPNQDGDNLSENLYRILDKSLNSQARNKISFVSVKATRIIKKARRHKNFLFRTLKWDNETFINYEENYYNNFLKKAFRKEIMYLYYVKLLSINNNKFKVWFLLGLKKVLSKIYSKNIVFNFVNLKYLHLNSDIFTESIATKLRNRQNRLLMVLKKALHLVKLPHSKRVFFNRARKEKIYKTLLNKYKTLAPWTDSTIINKSMSNGCDALDGLLMNLFPESNQDINNKVKSLTTNNLSNQAERVLNSTKHKAVFGVRLEAAGRLSKRLTASRSVFKLKYKGSLKNVDSSYYGLSSVILKGNTKSNIQYTKLNSKTRNGSFGLKGWVSGY